SLGVVFPLATFHMTYVLGIEFSDLSSVHYFIPLIVSAVFGYQLSMIVVYRKKLERQNLFLVIKEEELLDLNLNLENIAMKRAGKIIELEHLANDILNSQESIVLLSDEKKLIRVNDKFYELFSDFYSLNDFLAKHNSISEFFINNPEGDYLEKEVNGMSWLEFASKNTKTNHHVLIKYHGVKKYYDVTAKELSSDDQKLYVATFTDITSLVSYRMQLEEYSEKIKKQLFTDALTGLPNRLKLLEDIKSYHLSVITLNIDSFQELNNYFGNDVGDEILAEVSERINEKINHDAAINQYRIGGDIYAITFVKSMHKDVLIAYAEELSDAVAGKNLKQKMISNLPFL
ncbi:MAG: PAS domain-containing protein, partial [Spirochaetia bacterium]|nr:PAS domain-containing protein [Spirochaetia bacterium]